MRITLCAVSLVFLSLMSPQEAAPPTTPPDAPRTTEELKKKIKASLSHLKEEEARYGPEHERVVIRRSMIALIYAVACDYREAEALAKSAYAAWERRGDWQSMPVLAGIYEMQGKHRLAEPIYRLRTEMARQDSPIAAAEALRTLGNCLSNQGRFAEAEQTYEDMMEVDQNGTRHSQVLFLKARLRVVQGRYGQAVTLMRQKMDLDMQVYGPLSQYENRINLAALLITQRQNSEAEALLKEAVASSKHQDARLRLGGLYLKMGRWEQATEVCRSAVEENEKSFGKGEFGDRFLAEPIFCLARILWAQEKYGEAEAQFERSYDLQADRPHVALASQLRVRAMLYQKAGRTTEAGASCDRAVAVLNRHENPECPLLSPDTIPILEDCAGILASLNRRQDAARLADQAATLRKRYPYGLAPEHTNYLIQEW